MRLFAMLLTLGFSSSALHADTAQERLKDATDTLTEIMATPDRGIPQDLLDKAHCAIIVPSLKQAAFVVGGKYGRGFATCRRERGGWGAPAAIRIEGGSVGFQIGASSTDIVMLLMNERGMRRLLQDKVTLGAEASVAAGPIGRATTAQTDAQLSAEILSWSRSKGLFAGIALTGATLRNDTDENEALYGRRLHSKEILLADIQPPAEAQPFVAVLNRYSRFEETNKPVESRAADAVSGQADQPKTDKKK